MQFEQLEYEVPIEIKGGTVRMLKYTVWRRNGMDWLRSLIRDPRLAPSWTWNAYKKESIIGGERERVYDEPMDSDDAYHYEV